MGKIFFEGGIWNFSYLFKSELFVECLGVPVRDGHDCEVGVQFLCDLQVERVPTTNMN